MGSGAEFERSSRYLSVAESGDSQRKRSRSGHRDKEERDRDRDRSEREKHRDRSSARDEGKDRDHEREKDKRRERSSSFLTADYATRHKDRSRSRHRSGTVGGGEGERHRERSRSRHRSEREKDKDRERKKDKERDKERKEKKDKDKKKKKLTVDTTAFGPDGSPRPPMTGDYASEDEDDYDDDDNGDGHYDNWNARSKQTTHLTTDRSFNPDISNNLVPDYQPSPYIGPSKAEEYSPVSPISTSGGPVLFGTHSSHPQPPPPNYGQHSQPPNLATQYPHPHAPGNTLPSQFPPTGQTARLQSDAQYEYQAPPATLPSLPPKPYPLATSSHPFSPTLGVPPPAPGQQIHQSFPAHQQYEYQIPQAPPLPPPSHPASTPQTAHQPQPQYEYNIPPAPPAPPLGQYSIPQPYNSPATSSQGQYGTLPQYEHQISPPPPGQYNPAELHSPPPPPLPPKPLVSETEGANSNYENIRPPYWEQAASGIGLHHPSSPWSALPPPPSLGLQSTTVSSPTSPPMLNSSQYGSLQSPTSPTPGIGYHSHHNSLTIPGQLAGLNLNTSAGGPSPMLQPYQGTYQNISPMPSPLFGPAAGHPYPVPPIESNISLGSPLVPPPAPFILNAPEKQREPEYDPVPHAKALLSSLDHVISRVDSQPIIDILPKLTPSQLVQLRAEYKKMYHQVNIAKHIKMQVGGPLGKIAWAVALGPYESEGWWANSWYQKAVTRNELLIEALVGKSVEETRLIKKGFKDTKYSNSLEKAIKSELESQKFRALILMCLNTEDGVRDEEPENDGYLGSIQGHIVADPTSVKLDRVQEDVRKLYDVLRMRPGTGETVLIEVIICRNNVHLREVIRWYRQMYGKDLSKVVLNHSLNLVGESLTHRLSGLIDKPLRDAKLLESSLSTLQKAKDLKDIDLLISRAVRIHWDKAHLERVKEAYAIKYKIDVIPRMDKVLDSIPNPGMREFRQFIVRMLS